MFLNLFAYAYSSGQKKMSCQKQLSTNTDTSLHLQPAKPGMLSIADSVLQYCGCIHNPSLNLLAEADRFRFIIPSQNLCVLLRSCHRDDDSKIDTKRWGLEVAGTFCERLQMVHVALPISGISLQR